MRNVWNVFDSILKDGGRWVGTGIMCLMTALVARVVFGAGGASQVSGVLGRPETAAIVYSRGRHNQNKKRTAGLQLGTNVKERE